MNAASRDERSCLVLPQQIGPRIDRVRIRLLLRGHVAPRAHHHPRPGQAIFHPRQRQAEVEQLHHPGVGAQSRSGKFRDVPEALDPTVPYRTVN